MTRSSRHLPLRAVLAVGLAWSFAATASPASQPANGQDELIAVHRSEAALSAQGLLHADPRQGGWVAQPAGERWILVAGPAGPSVDGNCPPLLRHSFTPIQGGSQQSLCQYQGKVLLVVNTASQCGFTYQYEGLEALYGRYRDRGLVVVGFPSNDFGGQEPGTNKEIAEFCRTKYGVKFPMFEKQADASLAQNPFYGELAAKTGQRPRWNFHKYLIDRHGNRVQSFASAVEPGSRELVGSIERLLAEPAPANRS